MIYRSQVHSTDKNCTIHDCYYYTRILLYRSRAALPGAVLRGAPQAITRENCGEDARAVFPVVAVLDKFQRREEG